MKRTAFYEMSWVQLDWQRPFELTSVYDLLTHLASNVPQTPMVFEIRGSRGQIKYYFGADRKYMRILTDAMCAHGNIRFASVAYGERTPVTYANNLKISKPILSLKTDTNEAVTRAGLAALLQPKGNEEAVLQIVLGLPYAPSPTPSHLPNPHASWIQTALGEAGEATSDSRNVIKDKRSYHGFSAAVRLGATGIRATAEGHMLSILSALKILRSAGVTIKSVSENPEKLNAAHIPWHFPLKLSVKELANFLLLPTGDTDLAGATGLHPKQIMPPAWYRNPQHANDDRTFALGLDKMMKLSITPDDSKEHTIILGPTGSGKSTAMQNLILSDIKAGRSVLVIDPKADLVNNILARIPQHRMNDVVIIDPSSDTPVGLNPLAYKDHHNPNLVADAILAVFKQVFKDSWGVRSQDVISASLLTLAKTKGSSLLWLPTLLPMPKVWQR